MATAGDGVDPEAGEENQTADQTPEKLPQEYDIPRGHVGAIYEDIFKDLYASSPGEVAAEGIEGAEPAASDGDEAGSKAADAGGHAPRPWEEIDLTAEDDEIEQIQMRLDADRNRINKASNYLQDKWTLSAKMDIDHNQEKANQGVVVREQIPIPDSHLRRVLNHDAMHAENLAIPRSMMHDVERHIAIKTGNLAEHDNLLAVSKPDAPNYFKETGSNMNRMTARNIQPRLTEAQRTYMSADIAERDRQRPPMPKILNAEERSKNLAIIKRMQTKVNFLKNPRFTADPKAAQKGEACPFKISPECVMFRNYDVGGVYEVQVVLKNGSAIGRHVRVVPCKSEVFSNTPFVFDGDTPAAGTPSSVVAPGMAARFCVRFAPNSLNDQTDQILIRTELGDYSLPVHARRVQPQLDFQEPMSIGCILAGEFAQKTMTISNQGGEGSFRIIPAESGQAEDGVEHQYETPHETGVTAFVSPNFRVEPATFYLESDQSIDISIHFSATSTGQFRYPLQIEGDNGEKTPLTLLAISDAVRLEMMSWPTIAQKLVPRVPESHESPWSQVPWQMSWLQHGVQVGSSESKAIELSNGGYLQVKVRWHFVEVPRALLSQLAVGGKQRLNDDILKSIHRWPKVNRAKYGSEACPFTVSPDSATIAPFSRASFTFAFYAYQPVSHGSTIFAYLEAVELPDTKHCLLHYEPLRQLQENMKPPNYTNGLPLFGGAVSPLVDEKVEGDDEQPPSNLTMSCAFTAICLSGRSVAPKVACLPPLVALSGDVLPFVAHEREVILRNTGTMPAYFRFRLTSQMPPSSPDLYDPLWIIATHEVPPRPARPSPTSSEDPAEQLCAAAEHLATQWPPLPPSGGASGHLPGFGALATVAIEPNIGRIMPGALVKISITLRVAQESDIDAHLLVDLPTSLDEDASTVVPPMKIRMLAAARAPRVEVRGTSFLDYGVVRAHSRHTLKLRLDNPSDMPTVVQLRHRPEVKEQIASLVAEQYAPEELPSARSALGVAPKRPTPRNAWMSPRAGTAPEEDLDSITSFPVASHEDVVSLFVDAMRTGNIQSCMPIRDTQEVVVEPWVHASSGCMDQSGRKKHELKGRGGGVPEDIPEDDVLGVADHVDFIFKPECVALWPHQSTEVDVILRTQFVGKYDALVEVMAFDSSHSQCVGADAEVQLPRLRLSTQHAHFDITYVKVPSQIYELELFNDSDMPATFYWNIPVRLEACIECQIAPERGIVPPRSSTKLKLIVVPTREADNANLQCQVFVQDVMQPLVLQVSAKVYGPEVDYAVVPFGGEMPAITHLPRTPMDEPCGTYQISCGKAPAESPNFDFGEMELLKTKTMQLVLYNRTGIPTPFGIRVDKFPAWDPLGQGKKIGGLLEAATRMYAMATTTEAAAGQKAGTVDFPSDDTSMQTFSAEPQPAAGGRQPSQDPAPVAQDATKLSTKKVPMPRAKSRTQGGSKQSSRFDPKARTKGKVKENRWLLDSKHEVQAFRNDVGADFAMQKELKEAGMMALKGGLGYAVTIEPKSDWLQPFSKTIVTCTCYSDVPGLMEDDLVVTIGKLQSHAEGGDYRIPMRVLSSGNPLYLPDQQVGLNNRLEPARLLIETITPAAKTTTRTFKVGNNSMTKVHVSWKILSQLQVQANEDRRLALADLAEAIKKATPEAKAAAEAAKREADEAARREAEQAAAAKAELDDIQAKIQELQASLEEAKGNKKRASEVPDLELKLQELEAEFEAKGGSDQKVEDPEDAAGDAAENQEEEVLAEGEADQEEILEAIETQMPGKGQPQFAIINGVSDKFTRVQADLLATAYGVAPALDTATMEKWAKETLKRTVDVTNPEQMFSALQQYAASTEYTILVLNRYPGTDAAAFLEYFGEPKMAVFLDVDAETHMKELAEELDKVGGEDLPPAEGEEEIDEEQIQAQIQEVEGTLAEVKGIKKRASELPDLEAKREQLEAQLEAKREANRKAEEIRAMREELRLGLDAKLESERQQHDDTLAEFNAKCPSSVMSISTADLVAGTLTEENINLQIRERMLAKEAIPQVEDPFTLDNGGPPLLISPEETIIPIQGMATFTVTMLASQATTTAQGHYQYQLVGQGRYTHDRGLVVTDEAPAPPAKGPEMTQKPSFEMPPSRVVQGVARLPEIRLDAADLHDDDSDIEEIPAGEVLGKTQKVGDGEEVQASQDVISTLTIDCVGDCIVPRLIVDKKGNPGVAEFADGDDRKAPVFKFVHSSVDLLTGGSNGVKLCGQAGGTQHQGIGSCLIREVTLANENMCNVYCRFQLEGPFRIKMVEQAGKKPLYPAVVEKVNTRQRPGEKQPEDPMRQMFAVPARRTMTLQVEFVPAMVPKAQWTQNVEHIFKGDIVIEYPRDETVPDSIVDTQRVHLMATSRKPSIRLDLVPYTTLDPPPEQPRAELPPWVEQPPTLIEFGYVHVESSMKRTRTIILSSQTNVVARWRVMHVGRKRRPPHEIGVTAREDEDFRALDNREAFSFDISEGELHGPSKDGLVPGSDVRMPKWCPVTPALPKRLPHVDEARFEPRKVVITFKPSKNEVYKCRFRIQVEEGRSIDFICHGCGSYDEEDDAMEYQEA